MVAAAALAAASLACTPQPGAGTVAYTSGGALRVLALGSCRTRTLVGDPGSSVSLGHEDGWYGHQDWWRDRAMTWSR